MEWGRRGIEATKGFRYGQRTTASGLETDVPRGSPLSASPLGQWASDDFRCSLCPLAFVGLHRTGDLHERANPAQIVGTAAPECWTRRLREQRPNAWRLIPNDGRNGHGQEARRQLAPGLGG